MCLCVCVCAAASSSSSCLGHTHKGALLIKATLQSSLSGPAVRMMVKNILKDRNVYVDVCAIFFGISAWISINGLWVELPLMVQVLPEGWNLASWLSIIVQLANAGPICYSLLKYFLRKRIQPLWGIVFLFIIGLVSSLLLVFFWGKTSFLAGAERSVALFVLVFCLSIVDCTSSILFLPYMGIFKEIYLNSYLVGESLSGFLPALGALIQGVGGNQQCRNVTIVFPNGTVVNKTESFTPDPRFPVQDFFFFLFGMMVLSFAAFLALHKVPSFKKEHAEKKSHDVNSYDTFQTQPQPQPEESSSQQSPVTKVELWVLLWIQIYVCFLSNGALPSIMTYSCLPYGNTIYHLATSLSSMAHPLMAIFAYFVPCEGLKWIISITVAGTVFVGYILATALTSPSMLWGEAGGVITVISWIVYGGLFSYVKVCVARRCRNKSGSALFWCGAVTQIGSAAGALVMFLLVNVVKNIFVAYYVQC